MKIAATIARYLLGAMFAIFGLNGFLHFIPLPPPPEALAVQFMTVLVMSHYLVLVALLQIIGGVLLLANRFVPLALTILAPIIVNILMYHGLMNPEGVGAGALAAILWILVFLSVRTAFAGLFEARAVPAVA